MLVFGIFWKPEVAVATVILFLLSSEICFAQKKHSNQKNANKNSNNPSHSKRGETSSSVKKNYFSSYDNFSSLFSDDISKEQIEAEQARQRQRREKMREKWKSALQEIKSLVDFPAPPSSINRSPLESTKNFNRWKLLLDNNDRNDNIPSLTSASSSEETSTKNKSENPSLMKLRRQRFDGFASWEELLQQWADDAAEYMEKANLLGPNAEAGYSMSNYGQPPKVSEMEEAENKVTVDTSTSDEKKRLFKPRPVISGEPIVPYTDISDPSKKIWIVTTAALPWMTGTAVNPLLRAAYLSTGRAEYGGKVTLMIPWLEREDDRKKLYGDRNFNSEEEQEQFVREWLRDTAGMEKASQELNIAWYTGWVETLENSVYSMGDITALIPEEEVDICVLEEPEHLNWYRAPGENWTKKFKHVVGIVHTNYFVYAQEQPAALIRAPAMKLLCSWMCRAHCHRLIKLSGTLGSFAPEKELVENVHGVRRTFLDYGIELSKKLKSPAGKTDDVFGPEAEPTIYFIGKMLWSKGIGSLMELTKYAEESAGLKIKVDMYGGGPNLEDAKKKSQALSLDMSFHGPIDHAALTSTHKIFINPSTSEVLCTTVAEALAMGKFVVVPSHPSNDFFAQFPNCLTYANKEEFVGNLYYAMTHSPQPLSKDYSYALSWEAATERFAAAGSLSVAEAKMMEETLLTEDAGIEIDLPPIIEDEKRRKQISTTIVKNRERFRQFRSRLSQEISQSNVLSKDLQQYMIKELDKRLNLDVDELLASPKMKIRLSPAELDKQLLELHDLISEGPSGDVLRVIGGGANVGRQNLYLKQQALKGHTNPTKTSNIDTRVDSSILTTMGSPQFLEDVGIGGDSTATNWIKRALRRNLLPKNTSFLDSNESSTKSSTKTSTPGRKEGPTMSLNFSPFKPNSPARYSIRPCYRPKVTVMGKFTAPSSKLCLPLI